MLIKHLSFTEYPFLGTLFNAPSNDTEGWNVYKGC